MILCQHPTIIKNPVQKYRINTDPTDWIKIYRNEEIRFVPPVKRIVRFQNEEKDLTITSDDLDSCFYLNRITGETIPMYIEVPCNKCLICRDKKAKHWSARCVCETQMHDEQPYFVTLTYNDCNLPRTGLDKKAVQNFMKRLRIRFEREGFQTYIRYAACGEYGSNFGRPHYHVMFWNLPKMTDFSYDLNNSMVCSVLQDAWAQRITKERYDQLTDVERYIRKDKNGKNLHYERIGFVHVKRGHDNTAGYLAKYMLKPQTVPHGMGKNFMLSSRKNGIGYDFAKEIEWFYKEHPESTELEVLNKFSGTIHTFGIPQYFKDIWRPTGSKFVARKRKYDLFRLFRDSWLCLRDIIEYDPLCRYRHETEYLECMCDVIADKYPYLTPIFWGFDAARIAQSVKPFSEDWTPFKKYWQWSDVGFMIHFDKIWDLVQHTYELLVSSPPDISEHDENMRECAVYKGALTAKILSQPQLTVEDKLYMIKQQLREMEIKDLY